MSSFEDANCHHYAPPEPPATSQEWWAFFASVALNEPEMFKIMARGPSVSYFVRFGWGKYLNHNNSRYDNSRYDNWEFELRAFLAGQVSPPAFGLDHPQANTRSHHGK
jgi:hypothetical protein